MQSLATDAPTASSSKPTAVRLVQRIFDVLGVNHACLEHPKHPIADGQGTLSVPHHHNAGILLARSTNGRPRDAVLGVLGGGQLGRMMALAAVS